MADHPTTGIDPDVAVLLPGPIDFDDLSSYSWVAYSAATGVSISGSDSGRRG
jgi:hypothetical protein